MEYGNIINLTHSHSYVLFTSSYNFIVHNMLDRNFLFRRNRMRKQEKAVCTYNDDTISRTSRTRASFTVFVDQAIFPIP